MTDVVNKEYCIISMEGQAHDTAMTTVHMTTVVENELLVEKCTNQKENNIICVKRNYKLSLF